MKTPISYYGGKQGMIKDILPLIPEHNTYTEPFAGGAAVLFAKAPAKINVINDLNGELINFYRTVVSDYDKLKREIMQTLHSREQIQVAKFIYEHPDYFSNVKRAWAVWVLCKLGFSGNLNGSFAFCKSGRNQRVTNISNSKNRFDDELKELLEQCTIEQDDAFKVIARYDTVDTFHFIDPPYVGYNQGHYSNMFSVEDMKRLLDLLVQIKGKFMLTMYPDDMIAQYVQKNGWYIHKVERVVSASNSAVTQRRHQEEWMVCNYTLQDECINQQRA
jgi:methyltransferase